MALQVHPHTSSVHEPTGRNRRTSREKLLLWGRAYETKVSDGPREVIGRGPTREASQEDAERQWAEVEKNIFRTE